MYIRRTQVLRSQKNRPTLYEEEYCYMLCYRIQSRSFELYQFIIIIEIKCK